MRGKPLVGARDGGSRVSALVSHDQHGQRLRALRRLDADDGAVADFRLHVQRRFQVVRVDVQAGGGDDDVFLAALEVEVARRVHLADVAGAQPAFVVCNRLYIAAPVARRDVVAAHEDFAALVELHFLAGQRLPDGAAPDLERVVDADERRRLRHAIALHDRIAEPPPEDFRRLVQRRAADDESPELPAELPVEAAEQPPPLQEVDVLGGLQLFVKHVTFAARRVVALDLLAQRVEEARHGDDDRDAVLLDSGDDLRRVERVLKVDFAAEELRHEDAHELAEDMAERQQVEEADRVEGPFPLAVLVDLALKRAEVRQQVAVRDDDALRLGGRPRREDDLGDVVFANVFAGEGGRRVMRDGLGQLVESDARQVERAIAAVYE